MTIGTGIVVATLIYVAAQLFFYWKSSLLTGVKRPAATEARLERLERFLRDVMGMDEV